MNSVAIFRIWFEQECASNTKMLEMLDSVPEDNRCLPEFQRAMNLAAHIFACRINWYARMLDQPELAGNWWPECDSMDMLQAKQLDVQSRWKGYLEGLDEGKIAEDFEFTLSDGRRMRWNVLGQIMQLVGHSFYHRGQVSMLVGALGGKPVDTDYLYWAMSTNPLYGVMG